MQSEIDEIHLSLISAFQRYNPRMFDKWLELGEQPYSEDDAEWDAFVAAHPNGSILQTTNWARLKNRFNWAARRVWLKKDGQLVAGAQILFRSAAFGISKSATSRMGRWSIGKMRNRSPCCSIKLIGLVTKIAPDW